MESAHGPLRPELDAPSAPAPLRTPPLHALVLTGGSIKGAFQAGAIKVLLDHGYTPHYVYGVSVGALNGAFLADRAGRATPFSPAAWPRIGNELKQFWLRRIRQPADIIEQHSQVSIAWKTLWGNFNGLVSTARLHALVRSEIEFANLARSPLRFHAGVVDLLTGHYFNADTRYPNLVDCILASTAIPIVMPCVPLNGVPHVDGGVRDIAPLRHAIAAGASDIVVVACQAERLEASAVNPRNLLSLIDRVTDLLCDEVLQNDLDFARFINLHVPPDGTRASEGPFIGKRKLSIKVIRPVRNPAIDIFDFSEADIAGLVAAGEIAAAAAL